MDKKIDVFNFYSKTEIRFPSKHEHFLLGDKNVFL